MLAIAPTGTVSYRRRNVAKVDAFIRHRRTHHPRLSEILSCSNTRLYIEDTPRGVSLDTAKHQT